MKHMTCKVGTRGSRLAVLQTQHALERLAALFPALAFETVTLETPGDRDQSTDLRAGPPDFFTRDLDNALRDGRIDLAVHSAKDLPSPMHEGIDWFWLPWGEDPRDAWVLPQGKTWADLPEKPVVGVSSERREAYAKTRFPAVELRPVRGSILVRLEQLDTGKYDALLMAGAALKRLGLEERVSEWVPLSELPVPAGQGRLAVTFRLHDPLWTRIRACFVKAVRFVGAGVGSADYCTWGGIKTLRRAEVCLYDVLLDDRLLSFLPESAEKIFVGKRCGGHSLQQTDITALVADFARQGKRVVRLKGGDPGLFGRLAEETDELDRLSLPYCVLAGVSALTAATTPTGMLLTRRGVSRGFTAMTPRAEGGTVAGVARTVRQELPLALFMSVSVASEIASDLLDEGWDADTPAAVVFNAGADDEAVCRFTLGDLRAGIAGLPSTDAPGLLIIGPPAATAFRRDTGALRGCRVLLTCSEALLAKAVLAVIDLGGVPLPRPLIRLVPCNEALDAVRNITAYEWLALTSPSAVNIFMDMIRQAGVDIRRLPRLIACGPGSAAVFKEHGLVPELTPPMDYSSQGLTAVLRAHAKDFKGQRVLRLRSEKAGSLLADVMRQQGAVVDDLVLYRNEAVKYESLPEYDAVFFASASAVEAFMSQYPATALDNKMIVAIGKPTTAALAAVGRLPDTVAVAATVEDAIMALARLAAFH